MIERPPGGGITARKLAMILKGLCASGLPVQKLRIDPTGAVEATVGSAAAPADEDISSILDKRIAKRESARPGRKPGAGAASRKPTKDGTS